MTNALQPFHLLLIAVAGRLNRQLQVVIDYLIEENRVLKEQVEGQRLRFTDEQRMRLAVKAKVLGRRSLDELESLVTPVHGELILKLLREAGIALGSESANGSYSMWFAVWDYLQLHQPAYHRRVSYGCDVGCNRLGSLRVFSPGQPHSRIVYGQEIHGE